MADKSKAIKLLLIDDEDDFRRATVKTLARRGFAVSEAASGEEGIESVRRARPDIVLLDLKMAGMSGIETLQKLREIDETLPVIILTGHGSYHDALAGIRLDIVDFLQKPVDIELLGERVRRLLHLGSEQPLRERSIAEMMVQPSIYPRLFNDDPVDKALDVLCKAFFHSDPAIVEAHKIRSALVYDRQERFEGIIRFSDLPKTVLPNFLSDSPYSTYFTGMFLAQCKIMGKRRVKELMGDFVFVDVRAPLMEAVHLMVENHLVNIPVMRNGKLAGILRERDIVLEIANNLGSLS